MTCYHHYSVPILRNISSSHSIHPTTNPRLSHATSRIEVLSQPQLKHQRGTEKRIEGFGVSQLSGINNSQFKFPSDRIWTKMTQWTFQSLKDFFCEDFVSRLEFTAKTSPILQIPENFPSEKIGAFQLVVSMAEASCERSWCLERFRRFIALQWSKTPWSQFGKRPGIWIGSFVSCIYVAC